MEVMDDHSILTLFKTLEGSINVFQRVNKRHILDLYIGKDELANCSLLLLSDICPMILSSSLISVTIGKRRDGRFAIYFSLLDDKYLDIFSKFCADLLISSERIKNKIDGTTFICERYLKWQQMLKKTQKGLLNESEIKGLIGELYFLKEYLIPTYGLSTAINSWIGPEKANQDFVCFDYWYEVKSTVSGANTLKISSVEQLDTKDEGKLIVLYLDKTSKSSNLRLSLNNLVYEIRKIIQNEITLTVFDNMLLTQGYLHNKEYDEYNYKFSKMDKYKVVQEFPCLREDKLPRTVKRVKYELLIEEIHMWRED